MDQSNLQFASFLTDHRGGELEVEMTDRLRELVREVVEKGAPGSITLKIGAKLEGGGQLKVTPVVTSSLPKTTLRDGYYWPDAEGGLHSRNPRQGDIEDAIRRNKENHQ